jgi:hypothetical protein
MKRRFLQENDAPQTLVLSDSDREEDAASSEGGDNADGGDSPRRPRPRLLPSKLRSPLEAPRRYAPGHAPLRQRLRPRA